VTEGAIQTVLITVGISVVVGFVVAYVLPWMLKRALPIDSWLDSFEALLKGAQGIIANLDTDSNKVSVPETILRYAQEAVATTEQLWKIGQLEKADRKEAAANLIRTKLQVVGITVTLEIETLIYAAIEASVFLMNLVLKDDKEMAI